MYLHRIRVQSWRTLREAVELTNLSPGLNVIFGPNETGKSTVMDALCRGFFDKHGTGGADMLTRQPWSSDLGPGVEIEFSVGDERFSLKKRFLEDASSTLRQIRDGTAEKIADGRAADSRIIELISGRAADKGLTKPEHWGLGQVLWAGQGDATRLSVGDDQQARLREALKLTLNSTQGTALEAEIRRRYDAVFTGGGQYKKGQNAAEVVRLEEQLAQAEQAVAALDLRRREADAIEHDLRSTTDERDATVAALAAAKQTLAAAQTRLLALAEQQRHYQSLEHDAQQTRAGWEAINTTINAIRTAEEAVALGRRAAEKSTTDHAAAESTLVAETANVTRATAARDESRRRLTAADERVAAAERVAGFLANRDAAAAVARRIARATDAADRLAAAKKALDELRAPSAADLKALRLLAARRVEIRAKLDAASVTVTIEPARPLIGRAELDGATRPLPDGDAAFTLRAVSQAAVEIDGVGRITVRAGESDAATLAGQLNAIDAEWRKHVAAFAGDDLAALETLAGTRAALEAGIFTQRAAADESDDLDALHAEAAERLARQREWLLEDATLGTRSETVAAAQAAEKAAKQDRKPVVVAAKQADDELEAARVAERSAESKLSAARERVGRANAVVIERERNLAALRLADGLTDAARLAAAASALALADAAKQRLAAAIKPPVAEVDDEIAGLKLRVDRLETDMSRLDKRDGDLTGRLQQVMAAELYPKWVAATEAVEILTARLARARLDADAIKLLYNTVARHKQNVFEAVLRPVRHMVTTGFSQLVGPRYDGVDFDARLQPSRVTPAGRAETLADVDHLSFGTREQLMLLVRLSLARLLSRSSGRQCVVLDDPLVNADAARQRAALRLLEEAAEETQVIVFTCHPHAYESPVATRFDLAALVTESVQAGEKA